MLIKGDKFEFSERFTILLYGDNRVGKTYSTFEMLSKISNMKAFYFSFDSGINAIINKFPNVKERIMVTIPKDYQELMIDIRKMSDILSKKDARNYIIVFDTITHLQTILLNEARKIHIQNKKGTDNMFNFMNTQLDYGVNLSIMTDINKTVLDLGSNVIYIALARQDEFGNISPSIVGQSNARITGDMDVILYMKKEYDIEKNEEKRIIMTGEGNFIAGDRYDILPKRCGSMLDVIKILTERKERKE